MKESGGDLQDMLLDFALAWRIQGERNSARWCVLVNVFCPGGAQFFLLDRWLRGVAWLGAVAFGYLFLFPGIVLHVLCIRDALRLNQQQWNTIGLAIARYRAARRAATESPGQR